MLTRFCCGFLRVVLAALLVCGVGAVRAQTPGALDTSFGGVGYLTTAVSASNGDDRARAVVIQPDNKIVVAGTCANDFCLVRYLPDGSLDTTFGTGGRVIQNIDGIDSARAMTLQPDGKFVVAGVCTPILTSSMCVARFTTSGALDLSFGTGGSGWVTVDVTSGGDAAFAVALQGDGKIVLAGICAGFASVTQEDFCLTRLTSTGALDSSFGTGGKLTTTFGGAAANQGALAVAIQANGMIVAAGYCQSGALSQFCVARYESSGTQLDGGFNGGAGYLQKIVVSGMNNRAYAIALQPNGKILVGGECGTDLCLARFLASGASDSSFGTNGVVGAGGTALEGNTASLALSADGTFMLAGWSNPGAGDDHRMVSRYAANGALLANVPYVPINNYVGGAAQGWSAVALQRDGKVVVASSAQDPSATSTGNFLVARYHGFPSEGRSCSLDIDGDGQVLATTDVLIQARVALGMSGTAVTNGITFASYAPRQTWTDIRTYLVTQCGMLLP
jgi:uncharacterized delta-60 repeat protein